MKGNRSETVKVEGRETTPTWTIDLMKKERRYVRLVSV